MIVLASYGGFSGGKFGEILMQWEQAGVFSYILPFLLIFALIYGILSKINLFGDANNKSINAIIALATALLSLQFGIVSVFFAEIFPKLGVAMSIVLVVLVVMGLFISKNNKSIMNTLMWGSFAIAIFIVIQSLDIFQGGTNYIFGFISPAWWAEWGAIAIFVILMIVVIVSATRSNSYEHDSILSRALGAQNNN